MVSSVAHVNTLAANTIPLPARIADAVCHTWCSHFAVSIPVASIFESALTRVDDRARFTITSVASIALASVTTCAN